MSSDPSILFSPGTSLQGRMPPKLSLDSFELILHVAITPTLSVVPKPIYQIYAGTEKDHLALEVKLNDGNDIVLEAGGLSVIVPFSVARGYFDKFIMLEAWSYRRKRMHVIGLRLENQIEEKRSTKYRKRTPLSHHVLGGGGGAECSIKDVLMLKAPVNPPKRAKLLFYFRNKNSFPMPES